MVATPDINKILKERKAYSAAGANMGRQDVRPRRPCKLYLQYVQVYDGYYDAGGAYWGWPANLWCAFGYDEEGDEVMLFVRAPNRRATKAIIQEEYVDVEFFR